MRGTRDCRAALVELAAAAPIRVDDRRWGALAIGACDLHPDVLVQLEDFAELAELAISNAQAWDQLHRAATTDPLTGLANHRMFQERLRQELAGAERDDRELSVVMLDIGHFKSINDTHGHQVGDRVLAAIAGWLAARIRGRELVARIGGEEFAWILPESGAEAAYGAAERGR